MSGFWRNLRAALDARYEHELGCLRERHPWMAGYRIEPPVRGWYAVHQPTGTRIGPAKTITALDNLILADHQSRPVRVSRDVPYPLPGQDEGEDPARYDIPGWPYTPRHQGGAA